MSDTSTVGLRLTIVASERHYDLLVPDGTRVADVLSVLGVASSASPHAVATASGRLLGPFDPLDEVPAGAVLTVVRMPTHALHRDVHNVDRNGVAAGARDSAASGGRAVDRPNPPLEADDSTRRRVEIVVEPPTETRPRTRVRSTPRNVVHEAQLPGVSQRLIGVAAALALVAVGAVALGGVDSAPRNLPLVGGASAQILYAAASLLFLLATVGVALVSRRPGLRGLTVAAAPALAFGAGLCLPLGDTVGRLSVAVVAGCALAVVALALARVRRLDDRRGDRAVMTILGSVGLLCGIGTSQGWPGWTVAALVLGVSPLIVRALPGASLNVDQTQLLDTDRLATTIWTVRERSPGRRRRVVRGTISEQFQGAREVVAFGTAYISVAAVVAAWVLAMSPRPAAIPRWGAVALCIMVALAFAYQSRSVRDRLPRACMLAAAGGLLGASVQAVYRTGWTGATTTVFLTAAALGWLAVSASTLIVGGYRSTRMSRFADALEGLAVAVALPLGIVAADGIEAIRRLSSG